MAMEKIKGSKQTFWQAWEEVRQLEEEMELIEGRYIEEEGIVNPDGTIPRRIKGIDDKDACSKAKAVCAGIAEKNGLKEKLALAEGALAEAEDGLVTRAMEAIPENFPNNKQELEKFIRENADIRKKVIEIMLFTDIMAKPKLDGDPQPEEQGREM